MLLLLYDFQCDGVMAEHPKNNELEVDEKQNHGTTYGR